MGIACQGKGLTSLCGELSPGRIRDAFVKASLVELLHQRSLLLSRCRHVRPTCVPVVPTAVSSIS